MFLLNSILFLTIIGCLFSMVEAGWDRWLQFPPLNQSMLARADSILQQRNESSSTSPDNNNNNNNTENNGLQWEYCAHTSLNSYINFTFSPYPIQRGQLLNISLEGHIEEDIVDGTVLEMKSWHMVIPFIPGPRATIDICSFIATQYPNAPNIRCPISKWAVMLILYGVKAGGGQLGPSTKVPRLMVPGRYKTVVKLKTKSEDLTCAQAIIKVQ